VAIAIIGVRAVTLMGFWRAFAGIVLPAAAIMAVTLLATVHTHLQGILLTVEALGFFIAAMMLMPKVTAASADFWGLRRYLTPPETQTPSPEARGESAGKPEPPAGAPPDEPSPPAD
jgi:hypothetical protein